MYHKKLCILIISCEFYNLQMYKPRDIDKPCVNRGRWIYEKTMLGKIYELSSRH